MVEAAGNEIGPTFLKNKDVDMERAGPERHQGEWGILHHGESTQWDGSICCRLGPPKAKADIIWGIRYLSGTNFYEMNREGTD